jgi:phosphoribosylglycinamide formyltransferase-1
VKICLLTYDVPHRKTAQVFMGLKNRSIETVDFLLMPFRQRPVREVLFQHRPAQFVGPSPQVVARAFGASVHPYDSWPDVLAMYDHFLVCGSNIIEPAFANTGRVLNVHAGLIPAVRGLDSFKWAILHQQPLGNTLHRIDEKADAGEVIAYRETPVFSTDELAILAERHYENEIWMLVNFDRLLDEQRPTLLPQRDATMRMPLAIEHQMMDAFPAYRQKLARA